MAEYFLVLPMRAAELTISKTSRSGIYREWNKCREY